MATLAVYDIENRKIGDLELDDRVFNTQVKPSLLHDLVRSYLASARRGTAATKNRSSVRGGGAKPWRQKGTGRARAGSRRSPLWRGGGTIFGPMPRNYGLSLPKKVRTEALKSALSLRHGEGKLTLLNDFPLEGFKTRRVLEILKKFQIDDVLIVTDQARPQLERSARNIPRIDVRRYEAMSAYDILHHEHLILLSPVVQKIEGALAS